MRTADEDAMVRLIAERVTVWNGSAPNPNPIGPRTSSGKVPRPLPHQGYPVDPYTAKHRNDSHRQERDTPTHRRTGGRPEPARPENQPDQAPDSSHKVSRPLPHQRHLEGTYAVERER